MEEQKAEEKRKEKERQEQEKAKKAKEEEEKSAKAEKKGFKGLRKPGEPLSQPQPELKTTAAKSGGVNLLDSDDETNPGTVINGTQQQTGTTTGGTSGGGTNLLEWDEPEVSNDNKQSGGGLMDFDSKPQFLQVPFEVILTLLYIIICLTGSYQI